MDIKLPHSLLKDYLETDATPNVISDAISLCGPTVDRMHKHALDTVYDIEVITNRIDSVSAFGIAREVAAILPQFEQTCKLINNPYELKLDSLGELPEGQPVRFQIMDQSLLLRLSCVALSDVKVEPSETKTKHLLELSGIRALNNVVDISNELTLRFGMPVHIFDLDKIRGKSLTMRESKKGEVIKTLDDKSIVLPGKDIVITDGEGRLIDLCGVMGGSQSEVDENTTSILLFVPTYEPRHIRKTSLAVQNRTLAAQIYEKGPDPELTLPTLIAGVKMLQERAGAKISSNIFDYYPVKPTPKTIELDLKRVDKLVGVNIPEFQVVEILHHLGFQTEKNNESLLVTIPTWRANDITQFEDLVEEIARVYGYFRLPANIPSTSIGEPLTLTLLDYETSAKEYLARLGFTEIITSSLVKESDGLRLINPLSQDYEYLRTSLIPGLLQTLSDNRNSLTATIFELSNIYLPTPKKLPDEHSTLTLATLGGDYRELKGELEQLFAFLNLNVSFEPLKKNLQLFASSQTASILVGNQIIGHIGAVLPQVLSEFSLPSTVFVADLDFNLISQLASPLKIAKPLQKFASVFEDFTISSDQSIAELIEKIKAKSQLIVEVAYLTSYQHKHTFRLEFNSPSGNLTQKEVNTLKAKLI